MLVRCDELNTHVPFSWHGLNAVHCSRRPAGMERERERERERENERERERERQTDRQTDRQTEVTTEGPVVRNVLQPSRTTEALCCHGGGGGGETNF